MGRRKLMRALRSFSTHVLNLMLSRSPSGISGERDMFGSYNKLGFQFKGNELMEKGLFEPIETNLVRKIFPRVEFVINVGANIGYYVCQALHCNKSVIAFEPMASNLKKLMSNIVLNKWQDKCEIYPVALGNKTDIVKIYGDGTGASLIKGWASTPESHFTLTPCHTINNVLGNRLEGKSILMIVDVEGAENMMLEGGSILLGMSPKPIWLIEICVKEHQPGGIDMNPYLIETFDKFWANGYKCITADDDFREIRKEQVFSIVETGANTLGTYNFLFYDKDFSDFP